ncbi:MAG: hypothetical protein ACE5E5_16700 [Phycisphaerae bacterium]
MSKAKQESDDLCKAIRAAFKRSGWSILKLSKVSGAAYWSTYSCVVHGGSLKTTTASRLCKALGLELRAVKKRKDG